MAAQPVVSIAYEDPRGAPIAYEPGDNFEPRVRGYLRKLGASDPDELLAQHGAYVARARDAELDPMLVANTIYMMDVAPPSQRDSEWGAEDRPSRPGFYAVDPAGKIIAGPFPVRHLADTHAQRVNGYVQFEAGEKSGEAHAGGRSNRWGTRLTDGEMARALEVHEYLTGKKKLLHDGPPGMTDEDADERMHHWRKLLHIPGLTAFEIAANMRDWGNGKREARAPNHAACPDAAPIDPSGAACGCTHAASLDRPLRWHKDDENGYAAECPLGTFAVTPQQSNRRQGVLPWALRLDEMELRSFDTARDAKAFAQSYGEIAPLAAAGQAVAMDKPGKLDARPTIGGLPIAQACAPWVRVTKDPDKFASCMTLAREIGPVDDPKKVHALLSPYLNQEDQEVYLVVLLDVRDQLRGIAEVARGQRSRVAVDVADILRPVVITGASKVWCAHQHPSNDPSPSGTDKRLTRQIAAALKTACPDVEFLGHVVIAGNRYATA